MCSSDLFTIGASYIVGGAIPLFPYLTTTEMARALPLSIALTGCALAVFGAIKGRLTGANPIRAGIETLFVGGLAAGAAFYLASLFG